MTRVLQPSVAFAVGYLIRVIRDVSTTTAIIVQCPPRTETNLHRTMALIEPGVRSTRLDGME